MNKRRILMPGGSMPSALSAPALAPGPVPAPVREKLSPLQKIKKELGLYSGTDVGQFVQSMKITLHVVEGLLPRISVNLLVGDSGIGKSPLAYQLGLCVAAGIPFLGLPVHKSKVLLIDYENAMHDSHWMLEQQRQHLQLTAFPDDLLLWPAHLLYQLSQADLDDAVPRLRPELVIIDSLRSFNPQMESDNGAAAQQIKALRVLSAQHGTAFLLVHHVRKQRPNHDASGNLETGQPLEWLRQAAGAQALINQTDMRLAVSRPHSKRAGDVALVLRGHGRTRGEVGPYLLQRRYDAEGEPIGYDRLAAAPALLDNPEQEAIWDALLPSFTFRDARLACNGHPETANRFLNDLLRLGLAQRVARGK